MFSLGPLMYDVRGAVTGSCSFRKLQPQCYDRAQLKMAVNNVKSWRLLKFPLRSVVLF